MKYHIKNCGYLPSPNCSQYTLNVSYNLPLFKLYFFCLIVCVFQKIITDFENRLKHQVNIILSAFLDFDLLVHILLSDVSPLSNRKISIHFAHFRFRREILSFNDTTFVRVILFSKMVPKTISDCHKSLKISMPCDR